MTTAGSSPRPAVGAVGRPGAPTGVDTGPRPLIRWRGWRPALWAAAVIAVLVTWGVTFIVAAYQTLMHAGVCNEPAPAADLAQAQRALVLLAAVATIPWAVALLRTRYRLRVAVFAVVALAPVAVWTVQALQATPADYVLNWCLY